MRSAGSRSGVNWMRWNCAAIEPASVRIDSVLASPGTPSSNTWPSARRPIRSRSSIARWPTITRPSSVMSSLTRRLSRSMSAASGKPDAARGSAAKRSGRVVMQENLLRPLVERAGAGGRPPRLEERGILERRVPERIGRDHQVERQAEGAGGGGHEIRMHYLAGAVVRREWIKVVVEYRPE